MKPRINVQDQFLNQARRERIKIKMELAKNKIEMMKKKWEMLTPEQKEKAEDMMKTRKFHHKPFPKKQGMMKKM